MIDLIAIVSVVLLIDGLVAANKGGLPLNARIIGWMVRGIVANLRQVLYAFDAGKHPERYEQRGCAWDEKARKWVVVGRQYRKDKTDD